MTHWTSHPRPVGESLWDFPPPAAWPGDDVIATGADLAPATLIEAYRRGLFPMPLPIPRPVCAWWSPDPRGILPLEGLRITRSLRQSAKRFEVRVDTCFSEVIRACGNPAREGAWISDEIVTAFTALHELGWAHSVEVFDRSGELAGGLYGVRVNGLFAGESMFHLQRDGSKVALMALVQMMRDSQMTLLDVQWQTDHLASLGAVEVTRREYLRLLDEALETAIP